MPKFIRSRRNVCKRSKSLLTSLCRKVERGVALVVRLVYVDSGQLEEQLQKVCQVGRADVRNGRLWGEKVIEEKKKVSINSGKYSVHQNCDTCGSSPRWISDSSAVWRGHEGDVLFFVSSWWPKSKPGRCKYLDDDRVTFGGGIGIKCRPINVADAGRLHCREFEKFQNCTNSTPFTWLCCLSFTCACRQNGVQSCQQIIIIFTFMQPEWHADNNGLPSVIGRKCDLVGEGKNGHKHTVIIICCHLHIRLVVYPCRCDCKNINVVFLSDSKTPKMFFFTVHFCVIYKEMISK